MDKETLSNYGWIVILVLVLAVMLALATPFGSFIAGAIKSTTAGLFGVNQTALGSAGIDVNDVVFENCDHLETEIRNATDAYTGDTCCKACGAVLQAGQTVKAKVPEGGTYTAADGTVYNPGDEMPEVTLMGDKYRYGDYEYRYNCYCPTGNLDYWSNNESQQGWGVMVINRKQTSYGPILESINGYPITNMYGTFHYCDKMTVAPKIPQTVINMNHTFAKCESLISASAIPNSVIEMVQTFEYCYALKNAPDMSNAINVTNMSNTFKQCTSMETVPNLSNSTKLTSLQTTFSYCKSLTDLSGLLLPDSITEMANTFEGCSAVTIAPKIPSGVRYMNYTFHTCTSLLQAPEIPNTVYSMTNTFYGCTSLTGEISLPCSLAKKNYTYNNCPAIITYYHIDSCNGSCGK